MPGSRKRPCNASTTQATPANTYHWLGPLTGNMRTASGQQGLGELLDIRAAYRTFRPLPSAGVACGAHRQVAARFCENFAGALHANATCLRWWGVVVWLRCCALHPAPHLQNRPRPARLQCHTGQTVGQAPRGAHQEPRFLNVRHSPDLKRRNTHYWILTTVTQAPRRIQKVEPPILDANTPIV